MAALKDGTGQARISVPCQALWVVGDGLLLRVWEHTLPPDLRGARHNFLPWLLS